MNVSPSMSAAHAPKLWRRLACGLYEIVVLFGVGLIPGAVGALFVKFSHQTHPLQGQTSLRIFAFVIFGIYFIWCWSKKGQTLPMQTWHIRVLTSSGAPLSQRRALLRYLLSWMWIAPAVAVSWLAGWSGAAALGSILVGSLVYAGLALLHPQQQFWHDAWSGTRLVTFYPTKPEKQA